LFNSSPKVDPTFAPIVCGSSTLGIIISFSGCSSSTKTGCSSYSSSWMSYGVKANAVGSSSNSFSVGCVGNLPSSLSSLTFSQTLFDSFCKSVNFCCS
jgi:hypothetical protein